MAKIIDASIDFQKIQSARFKTQKGTECILIPINQDGIGVGKDGKLFLNIDITCNDEANQYGQDTSISLKRTKEQSEAKAPKVYIGNGKTVWSSEAPKQDAAKKANVEPENLVNPNFSESDLPF